MKKFLSTLAILALTASPVLAADNPFTGTWKLDLSRSHFTGDTFTYSKAANGMMHYNDGSTTSFDFGTDGKEYPTSQGRTTSWTAAGPNAWDSTIRFNGTVLVKSHRFLSADGKTLTILSTGKRPDGSDFKAELIYVRVTGTTGLVGKWRNTKYNSDAPDSYIISFPAPDTIHWVIPAYKETATGKMDGSDVPITGPTVPKGMTLSVKRLSPTKLSDVVKDNGKVIGIGTVTLSADGKTLTDVSWSPGKESEKQTGIYVKQ
jgi:hypothetical protein